MKKYKILNHQVFSKGKYSIVPIRMEDRYAIMQWRNEQIFHLRQEKLLSEKDQDIYFNEVISELFNQEKPHQILFSYLENEVCIGYGGLVHINWNDKNAEISFVLDTDIEKHSFDFHWGTYLEFIEDVAFEEIGLHKIYTYAFDLRNNLYNILERMSYNKEAVLKEHVFFRSSFIDIVIHSKFSHRQKNETLKTHMSFNVLVTSIAGKIPMLKAVKYASKKLDAQTRVFGGDVDSNCIGRYFVDSFWQMPFSSELTPEIVLDFCIENNIKAVIPTRDGELYFWASIKDLLQSHGIHTMVSPLEGVQICLDKLLFSQKLQESNFAAVSSFSSVLDVPSSHIVVKERFGAGSFNIALNVSQNDAIKFASKLNNPIFQPFVKGKEFSIDLYVDRNGSSKGTIVRSRDIVFNGESQITSTILNVELERICSDIAQILRLYGHVVFQALQDEKGDYYIIECNSRFGGASTLSIASGLDSFYWFFLETAELDLTSCAFIRSKVEKKQIRFPQDLIIDGTSI